MRVFKIYSFSFSQKTSIMESIHNLSERYTYDRIIFEAADIIEKYIGNENIYKMTMEEIFTSELLQATIQKMPFLGKYVYKHCLPQNDPQKDSSLWASNLGHNWKYPNNNDVIHSITPEEASMLENYYNKSHPKSSSFIIGFDEIQWFGEKVAPGTYGYEKARSGGNYLSNSILLSKSLFNKNTVLFVSIEVTPKSDSDPLRDDSVVLHEIALMLGNPNYVSLHCSPSTPEERAEWTLKKEKADNVYNSIVESLPQMIHELPHFLKSIHYQYDYSKSLIALLPSLEKIPARDLFNKEFMKTNWIRSEGSFDRMDKNGNNVSISTSIDYKGHRSQSFLHYYGPYFYYIFGGVPQLDCFYMELMKKEEVIQHFQNLHILADRIINTFSDEIEKIYGHVPEWYGKGKDLE